MKVSQQAEVFMTQLQTRSRRPIRRTSLRSYKSHLQKWILPILGDQPLIEVRNRATKDFVQKLKTAGLKPASVVAIYTTLKAVVSSARDEEGEPLYPVQWNPEFIDVPIIDKQKQKTPSVTPTATTEAISRALGADKALYALCAGAGLRIGEALSLRLVRRDLYEDDGIGSFWVPAEMKLIIRGTVSLGRIQDTTKTPAGVREIDLCTNLNSYLGETLAFSNMGEDNLMFPSRVGGVACQRTIYNHLKKTGINKTFHSFRRFRVTFLRKNRVPDDLIQFWTGHAKKTQTDDYSKLAEDLELRRYWVEKVGLGFEL